MKTAQTSCHSTIDVQLSDEDFGEQHHMASSEPYFYDESYAPIKCKNAIPLSDKGKCVVAEEVGKRKRGYKPSKKVEVHFRVQLPMSEERKRIVALNLQFDESSIPALRQALDEVDTGCRTSMPALPSHANTKAKGVPQ